MDLTLRRFLTGGGFIFGAKLLTALGLLGINALLIRMVGLDGVGLFIFFHNTALVFGMILGMGFGAAAIKYIGASASAFEASSIAMRAYLWVLVFAVALVLFAAVLWLAGLVGALRTFPGVQEHFWTLVVWIVGVALRLVSFDVLVGLGRPKIAAAFSGVFSALSVLFGITVLYCIGYLTVSSALYLGSAANLVAGGLSGAFLFILVRKRKSAYEEESADFAAVNIPTVRRYFEVGGAAAIIKLLSSRRKEILLIVVGGVATADAVAILGMANQLVAVVVMPMVAITAMIMPEIARSVNQISNKKAVDRIRGLWALGVSPVVCSAGAILIFSGQVLSFVYGAPNENLQAVLWVLILGRMVSVLAGPTAQVLILSGEQWFAAAISMVEMVPLVVFGVILTLAFGDVGAAWAFTLTTLASSVIASLYIRYRFDVWIFVKLPPAVIERFRGLKRL